MIFAHQLDLVSIFDTDWELIPQLGLLIIVLQVKFLRECVETAQLAICRVPRHINCMHHCVEFKVVKFLCGRRSLLIKSQADLYDSHAVGAKTLILSAIRVRNTPQTALIIAVLLIASKRGQVPVVVFKTVAVKLQCITIIPDQP